MGSPILNGLSASSSGYALSQRVAAAPDASSSPGIMGLGPVGIGLIAALAVLAYWYRRVL